MTDFGERVRPAFVEETTPVAIDEGYNNLRKPTMQPLARLGSVATRRSGVVYVTYDGAVNSASGVGVLSQYFVDAFPNAAQSIEADRSNSELDLHVIGVDLSEFADGYSADLKRKTEQVCLKSGGELHLVDNGTGKEKGYGWLENWQLASRNAAGVISDLSRQYDHLYAYLVDTPFLNVPAYYTEDNTLVTSVLVPHSDVYSHTPDDVDPERQQWEQSAFSAVGSRSNVYIAETSQFLLSCLREHYKLDSGKVVNLQTGLVPTSLRFEGVTEDEIVNALQGYDIPLDKQLLFSVARAVPYKGFDDLIHSYAILARSDPDVHLAFIASPHRNESSEVEHIQSLIDGYGLEERVTPIFHLDMELPRYICQWKNTKIVAQLSHREPFGLVPEEVRLWARASGPVVVASDLDGFVEQITDGEDGFLVQPRDHEQVAATFARILALDTTQFNGVKRKGLERCLANYDYRKSTEASLRQLLALSGS